MSSDVVKKMQTGLDYVDAGGFAVEQLVNELYPKLDSAFDILEDDMIEHYHEVLQATVLITS
jgi:hypothetical protein